MSLISSPSLPRTHSRSYTPLKYSPREQQPADSQPSARAQRAQPSLITNALWQGSAQAHDGEKERPDRLSISSDSSDGEREQPAALEEPSHRGRRHGHEPRTDSKARRPRHHRRKQQSAELSPTSMKHAALKPQVSDGRTAQAPLGPAPGVTQHPLPLAQLAGTPGSAQSIDRVQEHSNAMHGGDQPQYSAHSVAQLQSDLQHAQAAELHYLVGSATKHASMAVRGHSHCVLRVATVVPLWQLVPYYRGGPPCCLSALWLTNVYYKLVNPQQDCNLDALFTSRLHVRRAPSRGYQRGWRAA